MDTLALLVGEIGGRGFFDELLVASLQRAVAGAGDDDMAVAIGQDLGFDVARCRKIALDEAFAAAECRLGLAHGGIEGISDIARLVDDLHAAPAAAVGGFDDDG